MKRTWTPLIIAAVALACADSTRPLIPGPIAGDAHVIETYELQKIGDGNLPQIFSGGQTWWQINGGHYDLMADGTYDWYYVYNTRESRTTSATTHAPHRER